MDLLRRLKPAHLRLIAEIARRQKLQLAAEALAMSQPAASRMLSEIEQEAGAPLFLRHARSMEPTPLGVVFLRHIRVILWEMESLQAEVETLTSGRSGEVRVGAVTGPAVGFLMPALQQIKAITPQIEPTVEVSPSVQLVRGLEEGRFDFIIARLPHDYDRRDLHLYPARSEAVSLLVRDSHPLAGVPDLPLRALQDFPWVVQERGSPIRQAVEDGFAVEGVDVPRNVYNSSSLLVVMSLLASSEVISPQSQEVAEILTGSDLGARLVALDVAHRLVVTPYFVITNRGKQLPLAAQRLLDEVLRRI